MPKKERPPTDFEQRVYHLLEKIPEGKVTTYAEMAQQLQCGSAQAIGQALKRNPFAPEVPCHRVIKSDLTIGGYSGKTQGAKLREKIKLLRDEGVTFDASGKLASSRQVYRF